MERLKSIFISLFFVFVVSGIIYTLFQIFYRIDILASFSNLIILCTVFFYFGLIFMNHVPRTSKHMPSLSLSVIIGLISLLYFNYTKSFSPITIIIGTIGTIGWFIYTYWATDFSSRNKNILTVAEPMPNVSFSTPEGENVFFSAFANKPAIILFYRGNWCPFCMAQIKELAKEYQTIAEKGAQLIFISPQSPKHTKSLAKRFSIPAIFLIDKDLNAAKELDIFNAHGTPLGFEVLGYETNNVYPTLIITDQKGIVRFSDMTDNYRIRPEPSSYLKILDEIS